MCTHASVADDAANPVMEITMSMSSILCEFRENIHDLEPYSRPEARRLIFKDIAHLKAYDEIQNEVEAVWWLKKELCCGDSENCFYAYTILLGLEQAWA
jgi:hypothetical protein